MEGAFLSTLSFTVALIGLFFLPGALLCHFLLRKFDLSFFEKTLLSFALSLGLLDCVMLILSRLSFSLSRGSILLGMAMAVLLPIFLGKLYAHFFPQAERKEAAPSSEFRFSKIGTALFLLLLLGTIGIKTISLSEAILPSATDLGHHMYWSKLITEKHTLPQYEKIEVVMDEAGQATVAPPRPIADFIVGEHLPFAALGLFTHLDFQSAFPVNFLFFLNLLSILACITLAWRIALSLNAQTANWSGEAILLATFFLLGPLYTIASPQIKFVSGGVVGNVMGNLLIPIILLLFLRALHEKKGVFLGLGIFLSFILAYTHHLSTLVLIFLLAGFGIAFLVLHREAMWEVLVAWAKLFRNPFVILLLLGIFIFLFTVALPSYLDREAIDAAIGTPTKTTRTGLSFFQATNTVGMAKMALGLAGLLLLFLTPSRRSSGAALLFGWSGVLLVMTLFPNWLLIDIPSSRIGSYLIFPLALGAAFALTFLFDQTFGKKDSAVVNALPPLGRSLFFLVLLVFLTTHGSYENSQSLPSKAKAKEIRATFAVSRYLEETVRENDVILKDHNYIVADAWMKLFFLRDYGYPLSRGFFSRYTEGGSRREQCTLQMISIPNTPEGKRCFEETGTNIVVVNPHYDQAQFEKSSAFSRIYASDSIHVYARP